MGAQTLASGMAPNAHHALRRGNSASLAAAPSGVFGGTHGGSTCLRSSAASRAVEPQVALDGDEALGTAPDPPDSRAQRPIINSPAGERLASASAGWPAARRPPRRHGVLLDEGEDVLGGAPLEGRPPRQHLVA